MRVVHVVHWLRVAGLENGVVNLITALADDFDHSVICLREAGPLAARLPPGVEVIVCGKQDGIEIGLTWRLARLFRRLRPHIVHSRNWGTIESIPAARLAGVPIVVHGEHGRDASNPTDRLWRRNMCERLCSPMVTRFVTVSSDLQRWLVSTVGIRDRKITLIPNGVDTSKFRFDSSITPRIDMDLSSDSTVIGIVARLDPVKDHMTLLEAYARLDHAANRLMLVIVGDGPCRSALERRIRESDLKDRVLLLGERADIPALLQTFDVFVLSSIAEGMSNTVLEAMAAGLPVIATQVGGNPELVKHGSTGLLVPASDPPALAAALDHYLSNPALRKQHGRSGQRRVMEEFSLERMAGAYRELYHSLAATRGPPRGGASPAKPDILSG
jgi:sugar transferase (PEP-CTERM/EpsH1 system associated)